MHECFRGGLKSPRIVQEGLDEATILSLVATGLGVAWVLGTARWPPPANVQRFPGVRTVKKVEGVGAQLFAITTTGFGPAGRGRAVYALRPAVTFSSSGRYAHRRLIN